jgi:hypothetical protein
MSSRARSGSSRATDSLESAGPHLRSRQGASAHPIRGRTARRLSHCSRPRGYKGNWAREQSSCGTVWVRVRSTVPYRISLFGGNSVCTVADFSQLISTLQLSNPANVIFRIAPPFGSSPPVVSARLLGPGSIIAWPFLVSGAFCDQPRNSAGPLGVDSFKGTLLPSKDSECRTSKTIELLRAQTRPAPR